MPSVEVTVWVATSRLVHVTVPPTWIAISTSKAALRMSIARVTGVDASGGAGSGVAVAAGVAIEVGAGVAVGKRIAAGVAGVVGAVTVDAAAVVAVGVEAGADVAVGVAVAVGVGRGLGAAIVAEGVFTSRRALAGVGLCTRESAPQAVRPVNARQSSANAAVRRTSAVLSPSVGRGRGWR